MSARCLTVAVAKLVRSDAVRRIGKDNRERPCLQCGQNFKAVTLKQRVQIRSKSRSDLSTEFGVSLRFLVTSESFKSLLSTGGFGDNGVVEVPGEDEILSDNFTTFSITRAFSLT